MAKVLFVKGFPSSFNMQQLKAKFRPFGNLKKVTVSSDDQNVFGIVKFYNKDHADIAIQELNGKPVDEIAWYVAPCINKREKNSYSHRKQMKENNRQKTLYLRDFPADLTREKLREIFEKYGTIESVIINGKAAFVLFKEFESAKSALEAERQLEIDGKRVFVDSLQRKRNIAALILRKERFKERIRNKLDTPMG